MSVQENGSPSVVDIRETVTVKEEEMEMSKVSKQ